MQTGTADWGKSLPSLFARVRKITYAGGYTMECAYNRLGSTQGDIHKGAGIFVFKRLTEILGL